MIRKLAKLAAIGLLGAVTLMATSDDASARNRGRLGGYGYGYGAPVARYYAGPRAYGGYSGYAPRTYGSYYGNPYYGSRYYNNRVYNNGYYGNGYYNNRYYNGGYGNGFYGSFGPRVGIGIGW